ncbi:MAG: hypothetical protein HQ518_15200 [Rhodopirellula sp.]|nr:hypothetical protein [Rhodopirellula sp.]
MNTVIFHFVGGDAFFSGMLFVAIGAFVMGASGGKWHRAGSSAILLGWVFIVTSATAQLVVAYATLAILSVLAMTARRSSTRSDSDDYSRKSVDPSKRLTLRFRRCPMLCTGAIAAMLFEVFVYHPSQIKIPEQRPVFVIGDSLSAGINDKVDIPWPEYLDKITSVGVSNHAQAGATCRSALKQLEGLPKQCVVLVEIGGNDLLSGRSSNEFRADLDMLLTAVQTPDRDVVMFELPLPPLFNGYGYAQRELAAKHNVALIPRRVLASVLFSENATLDSIHLSNAGHQRLAERVAEILSLDMKQ